MNYDTKISFVPALSLGKFFITGFSVKPVKETSERNRITVITTETCGKEEAQGFALYALVRYHNDNKMVSWEWIADLPTEEQANNLKDVIAALIAASKPAIALANLVDVLEEQLTAEAMENVSIQAALLQAAASDKNWILLDSNNTYFDPATGNTYIAGDYGDHLHVDNIEINDWFHILTPEEMKVLELFWLQREGITRKVGAMESFARNIVNMPPTVYPYRWMGNIFQIYYKNCWKDENENDFIFPDTAFPNQKTG